MTGPSTATQYSLLVIGVHGNLLLMREQAAGAQAAAPIRLQKAGALSVALTGMGGAGEGDGKIFCSTHNPPGLSLYCVPLIALIFIISFYASLKFCVGMVASLFILCFFPCFFQ